MHGTNLTPLPAWLNIWTSRRRERYEGCRRTNVAMFPTNRKQWGMGRHLTTRENELEMVKWMANETPSVVKMVGGMMEASKQERHPHARRHAQSVGRT